MNNENIYICFDLKSFYASVECIERNLDPLKTNLVVADSSRTDKSICLAVTPALKSLGVGGRPRLFEVNQKINEVNQERKYIAKGKIAGISYNLDELNNNKNLLADYITACPRMAHYIEYSTRIYEIYLKYVSKEDIHVYSIDEVFIDVTGYLKTYEGDAEKLAEKIIKDILDTTKITATAGIGTNLYLAKVAMDIVSKQIKPNSQGFHIAKLNEYTYKCLLWNHKPLTDFWRIGKGYRKKLESYGIMTMGDVARCSIKNENLLYKLFGVNAELLIDHAWGIEPCTIKEVKSYKPEFNSMVKGQVLHSPYTFEQTKLVLREMTEDLAFSLIEKHLMTNQIVLTVMFDIDNLKNSYKGQIVVDGYGRKVPKPVTGTINFKHITSSEKELFEKIEEKFNEIVSKELLIRKISLSANKMVLENFDRSNNLEQLDLFSIINEDEISQNNAEIEKEYKAMKAMIDLKNKFGKNAVFKASSLMEHGTAKERNEMIGGHKA